MKINCEIAQDLLPLYEDGVCSESSRAAVEEHLAQCESCRALREGVPTIPEPEIVLDAGENQAAKSFRKVRRRWRASLLAVVLALPLLMLTIHEIRGRGPSFTNLDDIYVAQKFVKYLERGEYEKAAKLHDFTDDHEYLLGVLKRTAADYRQDFRKVLVGDEIWYMTHWTAGDILDESDAMNVWCSFLFHDYLGVLFTEEALSEIAEELPDVLTKVDQDCYKNANGIRFRRNVTPWGEYFTAENFVIDIDSVTVVPEKAYLQILPELEEKAQSTYRNIQEQYGAVATMTEREFIDYMEKKYAAELEAVFTEKYTVTHEGFSYAGRDMSFAIGDFNDDCQVQIKVHVSSDTNEMDVDLILFTDRGKVDYSGMRYWEDGSREWLEDLTEALYAGFYV